MNRSSLDHYYTNIKGINISHKRPHQNIDYIERITGFLKAITKAKINPLRPSETSSEYK
jgi:hypothetical protein